MTLRHPIFYVHIVEVTFEKLNRNCYIENKKKKCISHILLRISSYTVEVTFEKLNRNCFISTFID